MANSLWMILLLPGLMLAQSPAPRLFFSDLDSGPNSGGENNNGAYVTLYGANLGANPTVTVQCNSTTDKALGAGFAALMTGMNGTTLAIEPVNSAGTVITTGTPNGWKFTSSDSGNGGRVVYITCAP